MSLTDSARNQGAVEECIDLLNEFLAGLHYEPAALAVALRVHLESLLQSLLDGKLCTGEEVREFLGELQRESLQYSEQ
jgi:hypothetical protein